MKPVMTLDEVAEYLGISRRAVEKLIASAELHSFKIGANRRVAAADLHSYVERQRKMGGAKRRKEQSNGIPA